MHTWTDFPPHDLQVESETADSEYKLSNATQRLLQLEKDVALLKEKALNTSATTEMTEKDTDSVNELAEQIKKVPVYSIKLAICNIMCNTNISVPPSNRKKVFSLCLGAGDRTEG